MSVGYSEALFWSLTPRQVQMHFVAAGRRDIRAYNQAVSVAFVTVGLPYEKKAVRLEELLIDAKAEPKRRQSWQEQKALILMALRASAPPE